MSGKLSPEMVRTLLIMKRGVTAGFFISNQPRGYGDAVISVKWEREGCLDAPPKATTLEGLTERGLVHGKGWNGYAITDAGLRALDFHDAQLPLAPPAEPS